MVPWLLDWLLDWLLAWWPARPEPGQRDRLQGGVHAELAPQVVQVRIDGLHGHVQPLGHLAEARTPSQVR